jgi:hypothetical protein
MKIISKETVRSFFLFAALTMLVSVSVLPLGSCLFWVSDVTLQAIEDQTVSVNIPLSVPLSAESPGQSISYTYSIDDSGWIAIEGASFTYTFSGVGSYLVTITASNGLKSASRSFTVTVTP